MKYKLQCIDYHGSINTSEFETEDLTDFLRYIRYFMAGSSWPMDINDDLVLDSSDRYIDSFWDGRKIRKNKKVKTGKGRSNE